MDDFEKLLVGGAIALFSGLLIALVGQFVTLIGWPTWKRAFLTRSITLAPDANQGGSARFKAGNGSFWTMSQASLFLTLEITPEDVLDGPVFIGPGDRFVPLLFDSLCWNMRHDGKNAVRIDLRAGEQQGFTLCGRCGNHIEIPSEDGWSGTKRVFLKRHRTYCGRLSFVSADTDAVEYLVRIHSDGDTICELLPIPESGYFMFGLVGAPKRSSVVAR